MVDDSALTAEWVGSTVPGLARDHDRLASMGAAAAALIHRDADDRLARLISEVAR